MFTEISVNDINDFRLGHASNKEAGTGVTVIYFPDGATAGCDISGGGPASRETPLTMPMTADNPINAIVLSGGSAYGLAASDGVMTCLEEHGIGYNTGAFHLFHLYASHAYLILDMEVLKYALTAQWVTKPACRHLRIAANLFRVVSVPEQVRLSAKLWE